MFLFGGSVIYAAVRTAILAAALIGQGAWSLASAFWRLPRTIGFAAFALKYFTLVSIGNAIAGLGWLGRAIGGAARAVWGFTASLLLNPVFLIGAAIAAAVAGIGYAAYLIYKYWRDIPAFFAGVWQDIKAWFLTPFGEWDKAIAEAVLGAWKAVISGLKGLPAWFMGIWDRVEAAFDVAGWIEALRSWSLTAAMQGWVAGAVSWFQRTWSSIEAAFDVAGWIEALRSWSLTAAMQGWVRRRRVVVPAHLVEHRGRLRRGRLDRGAPQLVAHRRHAGLGRRRRVVVPAHLVEHRGRLRRGRLDRGAPQLVAHRRHAGLGRRRRVVVPAHLVEHRGRLRRGRLDRGAPQLVAHRRHAGLGRRRRVVVPAHLVEHRGRLRRGRLDRGAPQLVAHRRHAGLGSPAPCRGSSAPGRASRPPSTWPAGSRRSRASAFSTR